VGANTNGASDNSGNIKNDEDDDCDSGKTTIMTAAVMKAVVVG